METGVKNFWSGSHLDLKSLPNFCYQAKAEFMLGPAGA